MESMSLCLANRGLARFGVFLAAAASTSDFSSLDLKLRDVDHEVFFPGLFLKMPGRFYYQFGKPIPTRGRQDVLTDKQAAQDLYMHVKSEVERIISYLLEKRVEDKYRSLIPRMLYQAARGPTCEVPAFDP